MNTLLACRLRIGQARAPEMLAEETEGHGDPTMFLIGMLMAASQFLALHRGNLICAEVLDRLSDEAALRVSTAEIEGMMGAGRADV